MVVKQFRSAGPMTLNNYTPEEVEHLRNVCKIPDSKIKYIVWNAEVGENQTPHLQIYAQAYEKLSVAAFHKALGSRVANIVPTQNQERAIMYCKGFEWSETESKYNPKVGSSPFEEYGKPPSTDQGKRTDLESAAAEVRKRPLREILLDGTHDQAILTHIVAFEKLDAVCKHQRSFDEAKAEHNTFLATRTPQPWESTLKSIVGDSVDPRSIHWFVDTIGETGKTVNAKDLYFNHNAFYCTGGKAQDIFFAYDNQPIVLFNLVASSCSDTQQYLYKVLEEFKDGIFTSGKYQSCNKAFKIPHVIVFSNEFPDESKMKKSRIVTHNIQQLNASKLDSRNYLQEALARKAGKLTVAPFFEVNK